MGKFLETGTVTDHINLHKLTKQCNKYKNGDMLTCIGTIMYHTIMTVKTVSLQIRHNVTMAMLMMIC